MLETDYDDIADACSVAVSDAEATPTHIPRMTFDTVFCGFKELNSLLVQIVRACKLFWLAAVSQGMFKPWYQNSVQTTPYSGTNSGWERKKHLEKSTTTGR